MEVDTIRLRKAHSREADNSLRWVKAWSMHCMAAFID